MFAFKVMVTTLILVMMGFLGYAFLHSKEKSGTTVAFIMIIVNSLSIAAIWG